MSRLVPVLPTPTCDRKMRQYTKLRQIGSGTFGTVYLAQDNRTGKTVVMKEVSLRGACADLTSAANPTCIKLNDSLRTSLAGLPPKEQQASKNEVRVLQALRHSHIIAYHDSFVTSGGARANDAKLCIVLEWASGGDMSDLISRRKQLGQRFSEPDILRYCYQMCSALAHCHHNVRLLHRDLKPANIFISADGSLKIGDFGISRFLSNSGALAQTQCGTPLYMSPEMARGERYTSAADVWAVGCIVYEMMALSSPWLTQLGSKARGLNVAALMHLISRGVLETNSLRKFYSPELCALLGALVSPDPASRPSLASLLEWPIMKACASGGLALPRVPAHAPAGVEVHAAAQILQRSFRGRVSAPTVRDENLPTDDNIHPDITDLDTTHLLVQPSAPSDNGGEAAAAAAIFARRAAMAAAVATRPAFIACRVFSGGHVGYVFKNGRSGLGYYRDLFSQPPLTAVPLPAESRAQRPEPRLLRVYDDAVIPKPPRPVDVSEAAPLPRRMARVPSASGIGRVPSAAAIPTAAGVRPHAPSDAAVGRPIHPVHLPGPPYGAVYNGPPYGAVYKPVPDSMLVHPPTAVDYAALGKDARKRACAAAAAAAQAAKRAVDAAAVARGSAAGVSAGIVSPSAINGWVEAAPLAGDHEITPEEAAPTRRGQGAHQRRSGDPLAARRALRAALDNGRVAEVSAAAYAAQKIIDSFKASQARRRAEVSAMGAMANAPADIPHQPTSNRPPPRALRVTPNRRVSRHAPPQPRPIAPSPYGMPHSARQAPRMGPPTSARAH